LAKDELVVCPFTVVIDTAEQAPWSFTGIRCNADKQYRPLLVKTKYEALGRYPNGLGDYSIEGLTQRVAVERKSCEDCQETVLGWGASGQTGRRERFRKELENLSKIERAIVVVECDLKELVGTVPEWGVRPKKTNAKLLARSILSLQQDYNRVAWLFCPGRRAAELWTFRYLERFWKHYHASTPP
jgi:hypothetical protein